VSQVKDLGISPGKGLAHAMEAQGFDAKGIGEAGGVKGGRPPPPPEGEGGNVTVDSVAVSMLNDLIESYGDT
jgi:hypothetical protein